MPKKEDERVLAVRSWADVAAIASLLTMFFAVVYWGLKLEAAIFTVQEDVTEIKTQVGNGILPRAEERIKSLEKWQDKHEENQHADG